jgi:hypothetical protein
VSDYYAVMPGQTDVGWAKLGPGLQAQGKASYQSWWGKVSNLVVVAAPHETGANTVEVTLEFTMNGHRYRETHRLGMISTDGHPLINTDTPASSSIIG